MPNVVLLKVKELAAGPREWVSQIFGRDLSGDDQVTVMLFRPERTPTPEQRQAAWKRVREILNKAGENARNVPEEEFEAAVEEAIAHARSQ